MPAIPWSDWSNNPHNYYDSFKFQFPCTLKLPSSYTALKIHTLAHFLISLKQPFHFHSKDAIVQMMETCEDLVQDSTVRAGDNNNMSIPLEPATSNEDPSNELTTPPAHPKPPTLAAQPKPRCKNSTKNLYQTATLVVKDGDGIDNEDRHHAAVSKGVAKKLCRATTPIEKGAGTDDEDEEGEVAGKGREGRKSSSMRCTRAVPRNFTRLPLP